MSFIESLTKIKKAVYGREVREAIHDGVFRANQIADGADIKADKTQIRQDAVEEFNNQVIQEMTDKDVISAPEIIAARGGEETLTVRLDRDATNLNAMVEERYTSLRDSVTKSGENLTVFKDDGTLDIINRATGVYGVQYIDSKAVITSTNYTSGSDFSVLTYDNIPAGESVKIKIKGKLEASRTIILRFGNSNEVAYISPFNGVVEVELMNAQSGVPSSYIYFDFMGNATFEIEEIDITYPKPSSISSFYGVEQQAKPYEYVSLNSGAIEKVIAVATSYLQNIGNLTYGNANTLYDPTVSPIGGKFQIDCSSFFSALFQGVMYARSRYAQSSNFGSRWGFVTYDARRYRYANQLAKMASEKGYGFVPRASLSDLRPGDVLFFSWDGAGGDVEFKSRAWMGIQHVAIFLDKEDTGRYSTLQLDNGFTNVLYMADEAYMQQCVYVARFPLANVDSDFSRDNLISTGSGEYLDNTGLSCTLTEPLKRYSFYTLVVDYELLSPDRRLIIQNAAWLTLAAHTQSTGTGRRTSIYRILYNHDDSETLKVSISGDENGRANFYGQTLYKGFPILG